MRDTTRFELLGAPGLAYVMKRYSRSAIPARYLAVLEGSYLADGTLLESNGEGGVQDSFRELDGGWLLTQLEHWVPEGACVPINAR